MKRALAALFALFALAGVAFATTEGSNADEQEMQLLEARIHAQVDHGIRQALTRIKALE